MASIPHPRSTRPIHTTSRTPPRGPARRADRPTRTADLRPIGRNCELAETRPTQLHSSRSEEHTSELQSRSDLVCRLLFEKKRKVGGIGQARHIDWPCAVRGPAKRRV